MRRSSARHQTAHRDKECRPSGFSSRHWEDTQSFWPGRKPRIFLTTACPTTRRTVSVPRHKTAVASSGKPELRTSGDARDVQHGAATDRARKELRVPELRSLARDIAPRHEPALWLGWRFL